MVYTFKNSKLEIDEESFKEGTKDIQYVILKPTLFQMPSYDIKSGDVFVSTGNYIHLFVNKISSCCFIISPFINGDFTMSPFYMGFQPRSLMLHRAWYLCMSVTVSVRCRFILRCTVWMKIMTMFSGDLHPLHHYKINLAHLSVF